MEALLKIVSEEIDRHPDNIEDTVDAVIARASRRKVFAEWSISLIRKGVLKLIHDARHTRNVTMRHANGEYGGPAKVTAGEASSRIANSVYLYMIGGRSLGTITGDELTEIAESEAAIAKGHQFNVRLCRELSKVVTGSRTVRQCVSEKKLQGIFGKV